MLRWSRSVRWLGVATIAVALVVLAQQLAGNASVPLRDQQLVLDTRVTNAPHALTLNAAIAVARGSTGPSVLLGARSVPVTADGGVGRDGTSRSWLVDLRLPTEEREVTVSDGQVSRVIASPLGDRPGIGDGIDSDVAARSAMSSIALDGGNPKSPGIQFGLQRENGADAIVVLGSAGGRNSRIVVDRGIGAVRSRQQYAPSGLGGIIVSRDAGQTWSASDLHGMVFGISTDGDRVYAVREALGGLTLLSSRDGASWTSTADLPSEIGSHVFSLLVRGSSMWLGANSGLWTSSTGGTSWDHDARLSGPVQYLGTTASDVVAVVTAGPMAGAHSLRGGGRQPLGNASRLSYTDAGRVALIAGNSAQLIGTSATSVQLPSSTTNVVELGSSVLAVTPAGVSWTSDAGASWHLSLPVPTGILGVVDANTAIAGGFRTGIFRTTDSGKTWTTVLRSPDQILDGSNEVYSVRALNSRTVIAVIGGTYTWQEF